MVIILFLILPFVFFKDILHLNSIIQGSADVTGYYLPIRALLKESINNFQPLFWNKYNFTGYPVISTPEAYIFYPIALIFDLIFPIILSYNLNLFFHYSLGGIFMYYFLRSFNLNKISCFIGGLIFMFGGIMATHKSHTTFIQVIIWTPLILLMLQKFRTTKRFEFILLGSIFYGVSFLGAHPQMFFYSSLIILFFIVYYSLIYEGIKNYKFLISSLIFIIGILIAFIQFMLTFELIKYSTRRMLDYISFSSYSFSFKSLPILIFPYIFGNSFYNFQSVPKYFGPWNYAEIIIYFGIITIPISIIGFFSKNKHKYLWIFILIFSFLLSLGPETPLYRVMYLVPIYNKFRDPARNFFEFSIAFAILSALGMDYFINNSKEKLKKIVLFSISFLGLILCNFFIFYLIFRSSLMTKIADFLKINSDKLSLLSENINILNYSIFIPIIFLIIAILIYSISLFKKNNITYAFLVFFIILDLFLFNYFFEANSDSIHIKNKIEQNNNLSFLKNKNEYFRIYPIKPAIDGLVFSNMKNTHLKSETITGYESLFLNDYRFITSLQYSSKDITGWDKLLKNNNLLSILNTKYIILNMPKDLWAFNNEFKVINNSIYCNNSLKQGMNYKIAYSDKNNLVLENINYLPRFYFAQNLINIKDLNEAKNIFWNSESNIKILNFNPSKDTLVENMDKDFKSFDNQLSKLEIINYDNNSAVLKTSSENDSFLVFSDYFYPGWKAYIGDNNVTIYKTNGIFKGIFIPKGKHIIKFIFIPNNFYIYIAISLLSLILSVFFIFYFFKKNNLK